MLVTPIFAETAQVSSNTATAVFPQILWLVGCIGLFYFLIWRPQAQQQAGKKELLEALRVGDVIYTNGGIVGKITQQHQNFYQIEIAENTRIYIQKEAITSCVPKGSLKKLGFK